MAYKVLRVFVVDSEQVLEQSQQLKEVQALFGLFSPALSRSLCEDGWRLSTSQYNTLKDCVWKSCTFSSYLTGLLIYMINAEVGLKVSLW